MIRLMFLAVIVFTLISCSIGESQVVESPKDPGSTPAKSVPPQNAATTKPMPIYVTPYYNSKGPQIDVGDYSKELVAATSDSIAALSTKLKEKWSSLSVETMYVLSIRLYDLGQKDDAVYWFYSAQFRAKLFASILPKESIGGMGSEGFERLHAHNSFHQLAGQYINGYAFGDLKKLDKTIRRVKLESEKNPKFKTIYPKLDFPDEKSWAKKRDDIAAGLDKMLDYMAENADKIKAMRIENGIEGKY